MKVKCPYCHKTMRVRPGHLLGKYLICLYCHRPFSWQEASSKKENTGIGNGKQPDNESGVNPPENGGKPPISHNKQNKPKNK